MNLSRKAIGRVGLAVRFEKELHQPELLSPLGKPARLELTMPAPAPAHGPAVHRQIGGLCPRKPPRQSRQDGRSAEHFVQGGVRGRPSASPLLPGEPQPVLAFAYGDEPAAVTLAAERRKPQVTVRQLLVARVEEGVVKYDFTFFYNVLYSGVKSLRIDVPADVAAGLRVATPGIHEKTIEPPPADLAKGDVAWSLSGDSEFIGDGKHQADLGKADRKTRRRQERRFRRCRT